LVLLIVISLFIMLGVLIYQDFIEEPLLIIQEPEIREPVTIMFVGDIMLSRGVDYYMEENDDYKYPFLKIKNYLENAELLIGNLEGPISDKGYNVGSIYSFRHKPESVEGLTYAGFDILNLANNHIMDYTREAMEQTFEILEQNNIEYIGTGEDYSSAHQPKIKTLSNGLNVAFLGYTSFGSELWEATNEQSGVARIKKEEIENDIILAKAMADIVVVNFHFGEEYETRSNLEQQDLAHFSIDSGVDLVIGHHPHVVQEIEFYKGKYIAYSLGNFVFDQDFSEETMGGIILEVDLDEIGIINIREVETEITNEFQVLIKE